jgi:hypothetical protein
VGSSDLARSLSTLSLDTLTHFQFSFPHYPPENHGWKNTTALRLEDHGVDHLSVALRCIMQAPNMRKVMLGGYMSLSPSLLWPLDAPTAPAEASDEGDAAKTKPLPVWPSLEAFLIDLSPVSPHGEWLSSWAHLRPRLPALLAGVGPGDTEDDLGASAASYQYILRESTEHLESGNWPAYQYRVNHDHRAFEAWGRAMQLATAQMPKLRSGHLIMRAFPEATHSLFKIHNNTDAARVTTWHISLFNNRGENWGFRSTGPNSLEPLKPDGPLPAPELAGLGHDTFF